MKTILTTTTLFVLSIFATACSNDEEISKPESVEVSFENTTNTLIIDALPTNNVQVSFPSSTISTINVTTEGIIADYKKIVLEMNISHSYQQDLSFSLLSPDGTESTFVHRIGSFENYLGQNTLRFSGAFTAILPNINIPIPAGNYRESQGLGDYSVPTLSPIFLHLKNKQVKGIWKLKVTDCLNGDTGAIKSWKIIFETGALNQ